MIIQKVNLEQRGREGPCRQPPGVVLLGSRLYRVLFSAVSSACKSNDGSSNCRLQPPVYNMYVPSTFSPPGPPSPRPALLDPGPEHVSE